MEARLTAVHTFWFGDKESDRDVIREKGKLWFGKDDAVDSYIRATFGDLIELAAKEKIGVEHLEPQLQLAVILLLDQFTRNVYRNDPRSFTSDSVARNLANRLCLKGSEELRPIEKTFLYLPFEHSEELSDQKKSVALYRMLLENVSSELRESFEGFYDYAVRHYDIIERFGRFPHRNTILGRTSTAEEHEFLKQPGSSF